ncbi:type ISP restriction/modification enzyme, partial [Acinetobacter junii]
FKMDELFNYFNSGLQTKNDIFTIQHNINDIKEIISDLKNISESSLKEKYSLPPDRPSWNISSAKEDVMTNFGQVFKIHFKPFDIRYSYYTGKSSGFLGRPRKELTDNLLQPDNIALATLRQIAGTKQTCVVMLTKTVMTDRAMYSTNGTPYLFPLYLYNDNIQSDLEEQPIRSPNLNREIVDKIAKTISLTFTDEKENINGTFAPIDLLDYIYAVLHSPKYRETYKEFLKIDFPRVPYPKDAKTFLELGKLGAELRKLHLLESPKVEQYITQYPIDGDNIVEKPIYKHGNVYINDTQYFANVPEVAWTFYIGGYQPAQKWLKDRKDRALDFEDILHYQKIIVALTETNRIMQEIDTVLVEI